MKSLLLFVLIFSSSFVMAETTECKLAKERESTSLYYLYTLSSKVRTPILEDLIVIARGFYLANASKTKSICNPNTA